MKDPIIPVVYHFFAHYRASVNDELMRRKRHVFLFVADLRAQPGSGIEAWQIPREARFLRTHNKYFAGKLLFQTKVIGLALRRDVKQIIYLGNIYYVTTWISAAVARLLGKRVYFWTHGWERREARLKRYARNIFYSLANTMLLYGHRAREIGLAEGFPGDRLHVVYNSLDYVAQIRAREAVSTEELGAVRTMLFRASQGPLLVCVGRLLPYRRLSLLLDAMRKLKESKYAVSLLLVGDGPERSRLAAQAARDDLSVYINGSCYDEQVLARLFMAADLCVVPARVGLTAIHSLAYGTPVLVADDPDDNGPEFEAIIPGFNGAHFVRNSENDLARAIREWMEHAPPREEMRKRCHEVVERFYNPKRQVVCIESALSGRPADDTEWREFRARRPMPTEVGF